MTWLTKTPRELFNTIPDDLLESLVTEKQQPNLEETLDNKKIKIINYLMVRHILHNHDLPNFVITKENLIRWLFCIYLVE